MLSITRLPHTASYMQAGDAPAASEGFLGRAAGATCFAFNPADPRTYLVSWRRNVQSAAAQEVWVRKVHWLRI